MEVMRTFAACLTGYISEHSFSEDSERSRGNISSRRKKYNLPGDSFLYCDVVYLNLDDRNAGIASGYGYYGAE